MTSIGDRAPFCFFKRGEVTKVGTGGESAEEGRKTARGDVRDFAVSACGGEGGGKMDS